MLKGKIKGILDNYTLYIFIPSLLLLLYWVWIFYVTQPAAEENTYKCYVTIEDIKVRSTYRGTDKLFLLSKNQWYMIDTGWSNEDKTDELVDCILSGDNLTATVWKHFPKSVYLMKGIGVYTYQVADLRNDRNIYWDITTHNDYQRLERIAGVSVGILLSISITAWDVIAFLGVPARKWRRIFCPFRKRRPPKNR